MKILLWQDSNVGNYIEFKIRVRYQESPQKTGSRLSINDDDPSDDFEWDIFKRYSNFQHLYDQLFPVFQALGIKPPELPPKVDNTDKKTRNQILTKRKYDLEKYLKTVIVKISHKAPIQLLNFLQLNDQTNLGYSDRDLLTKISDLNLEKAEASIKRNSVIVNAEGKPQIFYCLLVQYVPF